MTLSSVKQIANPRKIIAAFLIGCAVAMFSLAGTGTINAAKESTRIASVPRTTNYYQFWIANKDTYTTGGHTYNMCLSDGYGTYPEMQICTANERQEWNAVCNSTCTITNLAYGDCLGIYQGSTSQGAQASVWNCNGNPDQDWYVNTGWKTGFGTLKDYKSNLCLGLPGGREAPNVIPIQWSCNNSPDQLWESDAG